MTQGASGRTWSTHRQCRTASTLGKIDFMSYLIVVPVPELTARHGP